MTDVEKSMAAGTRGRSDNFLGVTGLLLFLLALVSRLAFLPVANNNGTDAWARYLIALSWLEHPTHLPSEVWLPLHFWLLGAALWIWNSEWSPRLLTAFLGAVTILPYWGIVRRVFDSRVGLWSALVFGLFGFHIAYSVTTSSEGPTLFFLVLGFYAWVRFRLDAGWIWLLPCGLSFAAATLCRYEVWIIIPTLAVCLLDFSLGWVSIWSNRRAWRRLVSFGLVSFSGVIGWMIYSFLTWGDPLASARRNAWTAQYMQPQHTLIHRLVAVPGALIVTLSPLIAGLAIWGIFQNRMQAGEPLKRVLAVVALFMITLQVLNSVASNLTMARFTLMYSWLLIPYAFVGLSAILQQWPAATSRTAFGSVLLFFLLWQVGTTLGAYYGRGGIAAQLSSVAPTLPLDPELRHLTRWLKSQTKQDDVIVVDQYNYEAVDITRYSDISFSNALPVAASVDPLSVEKKVIEFVDERRPRLLVYSPLGMLGQVWSLGDQEQEELPQLNIRLHLRWQGEHYRVYEIEFLPAGQ